MSTNQQQQNDDRQHARSTSILGRTELYLLLLLFMDRITIDFDFNYHSQQSSQSQMDLLAPNPAAPKPLLKSDCY